MRERTSADITIYGIGGQSIATVPITAASKRVVKLMEGDYIQLSFTLAEAVAFPIGSYCDDELFGRFYVTEEQMPRYNTSNGGYDYELKMDAWYWMWNLKQCMLIRNLPSDDSIARSESVWYLTWSLREQMRQYMRNLQLLGFVPDTYDFVTSDTDLDSLVDIDTDNLPKATEALTVSYNGTHLVDVLKNLADTWECEYWVTGTEDAFVIHFGKCENGTLQDINLATNAQNITPQNDTSERGDKLFYFGGADNIPMTYRKTLMMKSLSKTYSGVDFKVKNEEMLAFGKLKAVVHYGYNRSQTDTYLSFGGAEYEAEAEQWFVTRTSGSISYDRVVFLPDMEIPVVTIKVWADFTYTDSTGDQIRVTEEISPGNTYHWGDRIMVHSMWLEATNEDGNAYALDINQWKAYTAQTIQKRYDHIDGIIAFSDIVSEDSHGRYINVSLTDVGIDIRLYYNTAYSSLRWDNIEQPLNYTTLSYRYENVGEKVLYADNTLIIMRKSYGNYCYYYHYDNGAFAQYNVEVFMRAYNNYVVVGEDLVDDAAYDNNYLSGTYNSALNNNYVKHQLTVPAQTIKVRVGIDEESYQSLEDTVTFSPHFAIAVCKDNQFPFSPNYQGSSYRRQYDNTKLVLKCSSDVTIQKKAYVFENGYYYTEFYVQIPFGTREISHSDLQASFVNSRYQVYYAVQLMKYARNSDGEEIYTEVVDADIILPLTFSLKHSSLQSTFYVNVASGSNGYATFSWEHEPVSPEYFYLIPSDVAPSASLAGIPYIYWSDKYDDPASLLSIGDKRLQMPIYDVTEFATYGIPKGMTYDNGYIVKDGMAYKDGYIIPYSMIGDDDNRSLRELTVTDDTIYPDGKLLVKTVKRVNAKDKIDVEGQSQSLTWDYKQYHLQLRRPGSSSVLDFDRDYILPNGEPLKIRFLVPEDVKEYYESGAISQAEWDAIKTQCRLAGMQFNVAYNNEIDYQADDETTSTTHTEDVWIERNDDFGAKLPSEILYPQVLDPCVLVNWNVLALSSLGLIAEAEYKLLDKAFEYYAALRNGNFTFTAEMMSDWLFDLVGGLQLVTSDGKDVTDSNSQNFLVKNNHSVYAIPQLGQRVRVTHAALTDRYKDTRIIGVELSLDKPYDTPKLTIGETEAYSRLKQIEKEITKLN